VPIGARGGASPGAKPSAWKRASQAGSDAITCTGTSQLARGPVTVAAGWWSPIAITTSGRDAR